MPLEPLARHWEGGSEVKARSQDIGLAVLVVIRLVGFRIECHGRINFSDKEKDEASRFAGAERNR